MANGILTPDPPPPLVIPDLSTNIDKYIRNFVAIRDKKAEIVKRHKDELRPYNDALEALETGFLKVLLDTNTDNLKSTGAGTVYKTTTKRAVIKDGDAFRRHVIGAELWDLCDWRANATAVHLAINDTKHPVPGVDYSEDVSVGVRRA